MILSLALTFAQILDSRAFYAAQDQSLHALQLCGRGEYLPCSTAALGDLERLVLGDKAAEPGSRITEAFLAEHGFIK